MNALLGRPAFWVSGAAYSWDDVVLAAELWGDWARVVRQAVEGVILLARAEAGTGAHLISRPGIEKRANAFRYARDLETAEDTESWLRRWGLTASLWTRWLRMETLRAHLTLPPGEARAGLDTEDFDEVLLCEAVCSGALERLAGRLAERVAMCEMRRTTSGTCDLRPALPAGVPMCPPGRDAARYLTVVRHELCFRAFLDELATPAALEVHRAAHHFDWLRLSYQALRFSSTEQVREAAWAVSRDGLSLHEVAVAARSVVEEGTVFLDELDGPVRDRLVGARPGQLVGPVPQDGDWLLYRVRGRVPPSLEDPVVASRTRASLVRSHVTREVANLVRWP
jgi:hypothetical protein